MGKGRTAAQVVERGEISKIAKMCKANGGPLSFEEVENRGGFNLRKANGMTAYRVNQKWLVARGVKVAVPKVKPPAPQVKVPIKTAKPAPAAAAKPKPTTKPTKPVIKAVAAKPEPELSLFEKIQAEKNKGILAIDKPPVSKMYSVADAKRHGEKPKAGYEDDEDDGDDEEAEAEIDEDEVPDEEPTVEEDEEEGPTDDDLAEEDGGGDDDNLDDLPDDEIAEDEDVETELRHNCFGNRW